MKPARRAKPSLPAVAAFAIGIVYVGLTIGSIALALTGAGKQAATTAEAPAATATNKTEATDAAATDAPAAEAPAAEAQAPEQTDQAEATADTAADPDREAFVTEWAERIDAFNAGYPLEGYGRTFAEAAYDNDVDPRYSPAIARVESGSGQECFYPNNAWGWGNMGWSDWDTAIREHVAGLAATYGHTLTEEAAQLYNADEADQWYAEVQSCMEQIWPSE